MWYSEAVVYDAVVTQVATRGASAATGKVWRYLAPTQYKGSMGRKPEAGMKKLVRDLYFAFANRLFRTVFIA